MTGQQLKNSILQEAIEGRLVPQDPNDEPASVLLERIRAKKARLVKEKKIKKSVLKEDALTEEDILFEIPNSWKWCKLGWIGDWGAGATPAKGNLEYYTNGTIPWLRTGELNNGFVYDSDIKVTEKALNNCSLRKCNIGDVLIAMYGATIGKVAIAGIELTTNQACCACTPFEVYNKYLLYYLMASKDRFIALGEGGAQPNISREKIIAFPFPLPPLAEQHRIVEKIESLLPKVEAYGKAQEELVKLNEVLPEQLKKSILQEAIEGRLVPQNPNDEPASVLLERIRAEKARLVKEKKIKKDKNESRIYRTEDGHWMEHFEDKKREDICIDDEIPFELPSGWEWCRLKENVSIISGLSYKKENLEISSDKYIRVLRGGNIAYGDWYCKSDDVLIAEKFVSKELILKKGTFITPAVTSLEQMGKTALIRIDQNDIVVGGFVLMLIPFLVDNIYLEYLNSLFQTAYYKEKCQSITNKSGQAFYNLSRAKLLEVLFPLPPLAEQQRIVDKLEEILPKLNTLRKEIEKNEIKIK